MWSFCPSFWEDFSWVWSSALMTQLLWTGYQGFDSSQEFSNKLSMSTSRIALTGSKMVPNLSDQLVVLDVTVRAGHGPWSSQNFRRWRWRVSKDIFELMKFGGKKIKKLVKLWYLMLIYTHPLKVTQSFSNTKAAMKIDVPAGWTSNILSNIWWICSRPEKKKTTGVAGQDVPHFKSFYGKIS